MLADKERIDSQLISTTASPYSGGLHVLGNPGGPLRYDHLGVALEAFKHAYGYTVIDAPRVPIVVAAELAQASKLILLVFQLSVTDIRNVRRMLSDLAEHNVAAGKIIILANRYRKGRSMVSLKETEAALKGVTLRHISNDFRSAMKGVNMGQPLADFAARSSLRRDVERLAAELHELGHIPVP